MIQDVRAYHWRAASRSWLLIFSGLFVLSNFSAPSTTFAQGQRPPVRVVPSDLYYQAFDPYHAGQYRTAGRAFREAARDGVRSTLGLWIDSICYHAMIGECHYHMGNLEDALGQYDAALKLATVHRDWMLRVEFPPAIQPSASTVRSRITWGTTRRKSFIGRVPNTMPIMQGQGAAANFQALRFGGPVMRQELHLVRPEEINRCIALSLRRRREIMGPVCQHDPLTRELVTAFSRRPAPANHWSQAWVDMHLGLAYASAGRNKEAISALQKSILIGGKFDHLLSSTALLELGKLAMQEKRYAPASLFFLEATFAAAAFGQYDVMQEGFRGAAHLHTITNQKGVYPPLAAASAWAKKDGSIPLEVEIALLASENTLHAGLPTAAAKFLSLARSNLRRRDMSEGTLGTRFQFQTAHANFQNGNLATGATALTAALAHYQSHSRWLFQLALADKLYVNGAVNARISESLFDELLREPTNDDWIHQPRETLTMQVTPHLLPMEHWFDLAIRRKKPDKALEIADRIRRHRFFSSLPAGGRLLAMRWILAAPLESLSPTAQLQRQALLVKYPAFAALTKQVEKSQQLLQRLPLVPAEKEPLDQQKELFTEIAKLSTTQELLLRDVALRREPSEFNFPPLRTTKQIQESLPADQLALIFFSTSRTMHGFALSKNKLTTWSIDQPTLLRKEVGEMLQQMGHYGSNLVLDAKRLQDASWKESAQSLFKKLTRKSKIDRWGQFKELIVVPDGILWYVPFESLQLPKNDKSKSGEIKNNPSVPLLTRMRVRYAPTAALVLRDRRGHKPLANTAVIAGKLFPRDEEEISLEATENLRNSLPRTERLPNKLPVPSSLFATACDRLVVLTDVQGKTASPYGWSPLQIDRGKPGSTLGNWLSLPWGGPQQIVLPGFHTAAEDSLKQGGNGQEIFLTLCGLMGNGTRSILLSRWRTGGQSSYDLMHQYVGELPHTSAVDAWQRSVHLLMETEIDAELEPRVNEDSLEEPIRADHPFFWAGYLLVDSAGEPSREVAPAKKEAVEAKKAPDR